MKSFKKLLSELYNVPVVTLEKNQVDLEEPETVNEINKNLSIALERNFSNIGEGLNAAKKVLTMYGIELPKIHFKDQRKGKYSVPIGQYKSSGESHFDVTAPFSEKNENNIFTFSFTLEKGSYNVTGEITKK